MATLSNAALIEKFLKKYGWSYAGDGVGNWVTGWRGETKSFPLIITLNDTWVNFQITPLIKLGIDWIIWPELMHQLLRMNAESPGVKVTIDEFGDVGMYLQVFSRTLDYEQFADALGMIGFNAERRHTELYTLLTELNFSWNTAEGPLM